VLKYSDSEKPLTRDLVLNPDAKFIPKGAWGKARKARKARKVGKGRAEGSKSLGH
jgi:hypothetical protein